MNMYSCDSCDSGISQVEQMITRPRLLPPFTLSLTSDFPQRTFPLISAPESRGPGATVPISNWLQTSRQVCPITLSFFQFS